MKTRLPVLAGLGLATLVAVAACATGVGSGGGAQRNSISGGELAATNSQTVFEALQLTRPEWLTGRGAVSATNAAEARANVYMYGTRVGDLDYLRQVYVVDVAELRYWPAGEASARFGMGNPRGVIEVVPR